MTESLPALTGVIRMCCPTLGPKITHPNDHLAPCLGWGLSGKQNGNTTLILQLQTGCYRRPLLVVNLHRVQHGFKIHAKGWVCYPGLTWCWQFPHAQCGMQDQAFRVILGIAFFPGVTTGNKTASYLDLDLCAAAQRNTKGRGGGIGRLR